MSKITKNLNIVKVYLGKPFQLKVRLGGTLFKIFVKIKGVEYKKGAGFIINDYSAIPKINTLLERFGVTIVPYIVCTICGKDVHCESCEYIINCNKDIGFCICRMCLSKENVWSEYLKSFRSQLSGVQ